MSGHVGERLSPFLDGELDAREREEVARHVDGCAECARLLEELAAVDRLAAGEPVPAPEGYFDAFAGRVRERIRGASASRRPRVFEPAWLLAAAALVVAVVAPVLLREGPTSAPQSDALVAPAPAAPAASPPAAAVGGTQAKGARVRQERDELRRDKADLKKRAEFAPAPARKPVPGSRPAAPAAPEPAVAPEPAAVAGEEQAYAAEGRVVVPRAEPDAERSAESRPASREREAKAEREGLAAQAARAPDFADAPAESAAAPRLQSAGPSPAFRALLERRAETIAEARGVREAWRAFARGAQGAEADEARVRVIESGLLAYRLSGDRADLELARRDAAAYLKREDAAQPDRVRALLAAAR